MLFQIGRRKHRSVHTEIRNSNWIRNLKDIDSTPLPELFMALSNVELGENEDAITRKWTSNGQYTVASAYECQFHGATIQFPAMSIWQAMSEPKCKFFTWLVMHDRVLTANNLMKKIGLTITTVHSACAYMKQQLNTCLPNATIMKLFGT
jgi:hypothetical protein